MRARRWLLLAALALGLGGCMGYLRPIILDNGGELWLFLAGSRGAAPETDVFLDRSGSGAWWTRLADRYGAARAAAAWNGELWCFYPDGCVALRPVVGPGSEFQARFVRFAPGWEVQAAAVHGGELWALGLAGERLAAARRSTAGLSWLPAREPLELGASAARLHAVGSGDKLWLVWRKRGADGKLLPETYSAFFRDGAWTPGAACVTSRREHFAVAADPRGRGVWLLIAREGSATRAAYVLYRLDESGWSAPEDTGLPPPDFGSGLLGPALIALPETEGQPSALLALVGRGSGAAAYRAELSPEGRPGTWNECAYLDLGLRGPKPFLAGALVISGAVTGLGLGMIIVRRRRVFPLPPGTPAPAPLLARAAAWGLDNVIVGSGFCAAVAFSELGAADFLHGGKVFWLVLAADRLLFCFYAWTFEARWGATPGKLLLGLCVADLDGARPTSGAALLRNLLRPLDEAVFLPLPAALLAVFTRRSQRLGDLLAGTLVTTRAALDEIHEDRRRKSDRFGLPP